MNNVTIACNTDLKTSVLCRYGITHCDAVSITTRANTRLQSCINCPCRELTYRMHIVT